MNLARTPKIGPKGETICLYMPRAREGVSMPKQRYERREPTHEWSQIRPLLKDPTQIQYEILRPIVLFGVSPKKRSGETGVSKTTLYAKANLFD